MTREALIFLCNGAAYHGSSLSEPKMLSYLGDRASQNVRICLPDFVRDVIHLEDRVLDLLELAAYVFAADRYASRGPRNLLEYHSWPREFHFVIKVRDAGFWQEPSTGSKLREALCFMTGDRDYQFTFESGHATPPASLFDSEEFLIEPEHEVSVIPFSGGLDSLAGTIQQLKETENEVCLISHRSQPATKRTQDRLFRSLQRLYPSRLRHYKFECSLKGEHSREETQRTRTFLYGAIACALCTALSQEEFFLFENGVTSLNFPRREDLKNARVSRTTHPKTVFLLADFLSHVRERRVTIRTPFITFTKTDIFRLVEKYRHRNLIPSSVSCSQTYQRDRQTTHCGVCSQCVDRRIAAHAAGLDDVDHRGLYAKDFVADSLDSEAKTTVVDYVRQAVKFSQWNSDRFFSELTSELVHVLDYLGYSSDLDAAEAVYELCDRHGHEVRCALDRIRQEENIFNPINSNSLLDVLSHREFLKEPEERLASEISRTMKRAIPIAFQSRAPENESQLNDQIEAILNAEESRFVREHPAVSFALARVIPDHAFAKQDLLIESKYIRGNTSPSKATEGIAADLTKYPVNAFLLFLVYDPEHKVRDDDRFQRDLESRRARCLVILIR